MLIEIFKIVLSSLFNVSCLLAFFALKSFPVTVNAFSMVWTLLLEISSHLTISSWVYFHLSYSLHHCFSRNFIHDFSVKKQIFNHNDVPRYSTFILMRWNNSKLKMFMLLWLYYLRSLIGPVRLHGLFFFFSIQSVYNVVCFLTEQLRKHKANP